MPEARPKTRWGDREQRRRDILDAARELITTRGYLETGMRDIADGAGIALATVYSYFATKEHVFATLYAEALRENEGTIAALADRELGLEGALRELFRSHLDLYRGYGRHFTAWSALRADAQAHEKPFPHELVDDLRAATVEHSRTLWRVVHRAAERDDVKLADAPLGPALLWTSFNGLADHLTSERRHLDAFTPDELVDFAVERLAVAMTEPPG